MEKVDSSTLSITGALSKARRAVFSREAVPAARLSGTKENWMHLKKKERDVEVSRW